MSPAKLHAAALLLLLSLPKAAAAGADGAPAVVTDIAPVQGLVARVMQGIGGNPAVLVPAGASPHDLALKPSTAQALENARLVVEVGPDLTPWLERPLAALAPQARRLVLMEVPGTTLLAARRLNAFGETGAQVKGGPDPHAWMDPENGKLWIAAIADALGAADPDHAAAYQANAAAGATEIDAAEAEARGLLAGLGSVPLLVGHDSLQYVEQRFGLNVAGAVTLSDEAPPSPTAVDALRTAVAAQGVRCAVASRQGGTRLVDAVMEGSGGKIVVVDDLGAGIEPGAGFYPALIRAVAQGIAGCR